MSVRLDTRMAVVAVVVLLAVILGGQALAGRLAPAGERGGIQAVGRSGSAYLTGIRAFAAYVLWARLDPINDSYYGSLSLGQKRFLMPSIALITALDPAFDEPFYVGPGVLWDNGMKSEALDLASRGVREQPDSAILHGAYAQLLMLDGHLDAAARQADLAMAGKWRSPADEYDVLAGVEVVYSKTGQQAKAARVNAIRADLKRRYGYGRFEKPAGP